MWKNLIPIFEDYKKQFMIQYEADQLKGMFVFPNISAKSIADRSDYQKQKNILRELNRACEAAGIEKTDVQCFRRGFATYLVSSPQEGGLGKFPEEVFQLLGHADAKMIHSIYGSLSKEANARKSVDALGLMFSKNEKYEEDPLITREKEASEELINTALTKQNEEILFRLKVRKLVDQYNDDEITQGSIYLTNIGIRKEFSD